METKKCFKCKEDKPFAEFYKHPQMADGRVNKCKECNKSDVRKNRSDNIDYYRQYEKDRTHTEKRMRQRGVSFDSNLFSVIPEGHPSHSEMTSGQAWVVRNKKKHSAHKSVASAVRRGKMKKLPCEICGNPLSHGHHDDYEYPLTVRWLCAAHHKEWHAENGEGLNG